MEKNKITYIDTYNTLEQYPYTCYVEYCKDFNREIGADCSQEYHNWVNSMRDMDIEEFWDNLKATDFGKCEVSGTLGLWWGNPDIEPTIYDSLYKAVSACVGNCNDMIVWLEKGILYVNAMHHDGTNTFTIKPMIKGKKFPKYLW